MDYKEYLRRKALLEFWEGLSEDDKNLIKQSLSENENDIKKKLDLIEHKVDKNYHSFGKDVLANITGNYMADASIWLLSKLFKR